MAGTGRHCLRPRANWGYINWPNKMILIEGSSVLRTAHDQEEKKCGIYIVADFTEDITPNTAQILMLALMSHQVTPCCILCDGTEHDKM